MEITTCLVTLTYIVNSWQSFEKNSVIHGHHHYQMIQTPELGVCEREPTNLNDRYAVVVVKDDIIVGHLPGAQSKIYSLFLHKNGTIDCIVMGARRYTLDLPQGGLEIPCKLMFSGKCEEIKKLKCLFCKEDCSS